MGKKKRKQYRPIYIREWRKHRGLTLEQLAARIDSTAATVSRLETGKHPYSQGALEALADALSCAPADLIMRPPGSADQLRALLDTLTEEDQKRAITIIGALKGAA